MTLSIVMIVKDEAACLADCLNSVRGIADELVLGDTGSSDGTVAIAERYDARILAIPWQDDFAAARNQTLAAATGDWLLHLDADEVLDEAAAQRIHAIVDDPTESADAIEVTLANYCDAPRAWRWTAVEPGDPMARGHAGYIAVPLIRLFRNGRGFAYREPVHENITDSVHERNGVVRAEPIIIHHYGYAAPSGKADAKARRYLAINRRKTEAHPDDPKAWHDYGEQAFACGDADEAERAARRALGCEARHLGAGTLLANLLLNRGDLAEARSVLEGLEGEGSAPPHVVMALGAVACKQGRLDEARQRLEAVVAVDEKAVLARQYLARVYDRQGDSFAARQQLNAAAAAVPSLQEFQDTLRAHVLREAGERAYQVGDSRAALTALTEALRLDRDDPLIHNDLGVVLAALGQVDNARTAFQRALRLAPGLPDAEANLAALG